MGHAARRGARRRWAPTSMSAPISMRSGRVSSRHVLAKGPGGGAGSGSPSCPRRDSRTLGGASHTAACVGIASVTQQRRLALVLALNLATVAALVVVGLASHSLGVLSAGGDFLADSLGLALGIV